MRKSNYLVLALALLATAFSATAQKTAYGYTMMPCTSPSMISFTTDNPSTVTRLGTYSKAEPRSGAVVGSTLYMMGIDDDFNMWFYSIKADGDGETIKKLGDATCPGDLSYDYTTSTMYFIANSEDVDGVSAIGTVNLEDGKMTFTQNLSSYCKALAIDARGQMYAMTNSGYLLKVNKGTGETQVIGSTGVALASWWNFQSMEFDRESGTLYLAAWGSDEKTTLYTVDTTTGKATQVGLIGDGTHAIALGIPFEPTSGNAPERVSEATIEADEEGELQAILQWVNPVNDYSGSPLEGAISIEIVNTVTGEKTILEDCQPGEAMRHAVTVEEAGMYEFTITAVNAAGASLEQPVECWIGHDVPAAVNDAKATLSRMQLMVNDLSWSAPVTGAHGGYLDKGSLTYDIVRLNDNKTIASGLTDTQFSDVKLIDELTRYTYQIVAKNADGIGEPAKTNDLVNGPAVECPYVAPFNSWEESGQYWTILDGNEDGYPFVWYKDFMNMFGQGENKCFYIYQKNEVFYGYDFIISPPILFQEGHEYKITANVSNDDIAGYREEQFRFYTFSGYDMAGAVPLGDEAFTVKHPGEFRDYSFSFKVEDDGYGSDDEQFPSFIALCCCSHYDMGMLLVNSMSIEDITPAPAPVPGDVNKDGEVNIADVNALIAMILSGNPQPLGDVNGDSEINLADVNVLIDMILNK
ncbi:MAG: hypothetical protein IKW85_06540 [Muribaculaceae bacterium]|nr:hypothetical protein [Muribaculaceae bacterium]